MNAHMPTAQVKSRSRFYTWVALAAALIVFAGFARTYYLKELFGTRSLYLLFYVLVLIMTLWFILFLAQVRLVAARRTDLHRRLGVFGALLALLVVTVGATTIIVRAKSHFRPGHSLAALSFQLGILPCYRARDTARRAHLMRVRVIAGADTGYFSNDPHRIADEMEQLVGVGLTPMEVIQAATSVSADCIGIAKRTGAIRPGLEADLVVLDSNPLKDISAVRDVVLVINDGRVAVNHLTF